ncbi:hypothetical protein [Phocaeicola paurosaccharolyticus]|uniref:hypothetical protein n=1 Tax=Phocaeicola paurosaccharolyticus TaxID=732242 RepID=UPI0005564DDA|nr:hypothetical protein [Phocaeicola paurosaccharolyticus]
MENIKESYLKRVEKYTSEVSRLKRRSTFFVFGKITFFMAFLFSIYSAYPRFTLSGIFLMVLTLAIYLFVYWLDVRCMSHIEHIRRKRAVCLDEISYLEGNFSIFNDGSDYIDITHEYSYDLDLFGPDSLFARINAVLPGEERGYLPTDLPISSMSVKASSSVVMRWRS